jgi:hypothetical protein
MRLIKQKLQPICLNTPIDSKKVPKEKSEPFNCKEDVTVII